MMYSLAMVLGWIFLPVAGAYVYCVSKLYGIVRAEKPEWIDRRGSLSFFYDGLPRLGDPNVTAAMIGLAFSSRVRELASPMAVVYAQRVRLLLIVGVLLFTAFLCLLLLSKP